MSIMEEKKVTVNSPDMMSETASDSPRTGQAPAFQVASWARYVPGPSPQYCYQGLHPGVTRIGVVMIGCWIFFLSGYNLALMGSVSSTPGYLAKVGLDDGSDHTQLLIGTVNGIYWIGVMAGALTVGWYSDSVGRRRALVSFGIFGVIIIPLFASLQNFTWALVLRLLNGIFTGAFDSVGLNWAAESVDARQRGRAIGIQLSCAATGASIAYFIVYGLSKTGGDSELVWRLPLAFQLVFVFCVLGMVCFLPESPRWLAKVGLLDEAKMVLMRLKSGGDDDEAVAATVEQDLRNITESIQAEVAHNISSSYWAMFTKRDHLHTARRTWSALLVQFGVQAMVGVGVVSGYGIKIFETGGWPSDTAALLAGFGIMTQATFGIPGAMLSDKIGRRRAMVYGAIVGSVLLILIGICGHFVDESKIENPIRAKAFGTATVALVLLWSAFFGMTWLWCPFTYPSEIFPAPSRARGSSVGILGLASGSFFINMVSPYLFAAIGFNSLFFFGGLSFVLGIMCYLWMPETAKKTLEEIDSLYD